MPDTTLLDIPQAEQDQMLAALRCKLAHYTAAFSRHSVTLPAYEI